LIDIKSDARWAEMFRKKEEKIFFFCGGKEEKIKLERA
jgi:ribosomal protein L24E